MNAIKHHYPAAKADQQPTPWWYFGRAVYVSRRDYWDIFKTFASAGCAVGFAGIALKRKDPLKVPLGFAGVSLGLLAYSLIGLYRMYGHPALQYMQRLLDLGDVDGAATVADLNIGTYRHAYLLADLLPEATIHSIDCWHADGPPAEEAVQDVRDLEPQPVGHPRIIPDRADHFVLPLADASVDVVVFGFGTHEIPVDDGSRDKLFAEAVRVLKPGGKALLFEHGWDFHNYMIFGPVIKHVTKRHDWHATMRQYFANVLFDRTSHAVDLFAAKKR